MPEPDWEFVKPPKRRKRFHKRRKVVYALTEPGLGGAIRYVGATENINSRFRQHISALTMRGTDRTLCIERRLVWVQRILDRGLVPGLVILESVDGRKSLAERERWWISKLLCEGCDLLNWMWTQGDGPEMWHI